MSIWQNSANGKGPYALPENLKTDAVIIGGGIAGLLTAYKLTEKGIKCVVIEQDRICSGITKNTTAKITSQHNLIYQKLLSSKGREQTKKYLASNEKAVQEYKRLCKTMDCDFEEKDSYIYTTRNRGKIEAEAAALNSIGYPAEFKEEIELPFKIYGAVKFPNQAQFHPLKFLSVIARDLTIFEHTKALSVEKNNTVVTDRGRVTGDYIIVTTHFPFLNKHGFYFMKMHQQRSYVVALAHAAPSLNGMYLDENPDGFSVRSYQDLLLFGGGGHRTGKPGGGYETLKNSYKKFFPDSVITCQWAAQDCMTLDEVPYIGTYAKTTPNLLVATGFNKWGMTSSMTASEILTDIVLKRKNEWEDLYTPQRFQFNKQFFTNSLESIAGLCNFSTKRCTHLGCALHYNKQEHTWDCACHGSRFHENGEVIDNPAQKNRKSRLTPKKEN